MWPLKLDMTKEECRGVLRRLELEAYSSVISTFRAQGSLDTSKQSMLDQLRRSFHISEDRHKAEARRVANSEKLTTISELTTGKSFDLEWIREGHRNYPLIGRTPPYSALHILADHASKAALVENSELSRPSDTKRAKVWSIQENRGQQIVTDDPNLPPPSSTNFGISRKDLKKSFDLTSLHQNVRKKHYQLLKPPPPPNVKIQHLYQTLANIKRPRKSLTKKCSKTRIIKQLPGKMTYPSEERQFDGAELQRHLTSQLMPPPMSPVKSASLSQGGVVKKDSNLMKMNNQLIEPHVNIVSINPTRLKSELMNESTKARTARTKSSNIHSRLSYHQKYSNGAGSRSIDNIPDPQIIFNTTSLKIESKTMEQHNSHESDLTQQSMTSPLQLLSTAASCTPKLKVTPVTSSQLLPSYKTVPNRAMKIVPTTAKPVIIKPADPVKPSQTVITTQSSKFKIQKIQLVVNKNQDGSAANTSNLSPSATIVSGKAGQLLLSGKGITNSYHLSGKTPYTIVNAQKSIGPKVIVQTIDRCFSDSSIPENQRITENTPIDFMPASSTSSFPKVIIQKTQPTKQIKLKLGTSLVSPKIIKGPIPANLKIHRNINTKGFTVVNSSQIVQFQPQNVQPAQVPPSSNPTEGSKVDWEQELDDANRKDGKSNISNGSLEPAAKKIRIDEGESGLNSVEASDVIEILNTASVIYGSKLDQTQPNSSENIVSEYLYLDDESTTKPVQEVNSLLKVSEDGETENEQAERQPKNGAEAYENLVKSLAEESEYLKDIGEEPMDENFGLLEQFSASGLFQ